MTSTPTTSPVVEAGGPVKAGCEWCGHPLPMDAVTDCPGCGRPMAAPMRSAVIKGSVWTLGGYAANNVLRFFGNLALVHLLLPQHFGLMALVSSFMQGLHMFSDIGIGPSVIQNPRGDDPAFLNTAWTLQVLRGAVIWACATALAYPMSVFYHVPMLKYVLAVASVTALIGGFNSTALYTLNRRLTLGKLTLLNLGTYIVNLATMLIWARISPTVWALLGGGLASGIVWLFASRMLVKGHRDRFAWDREALRSLTSFGRWIFLSTALTFMACQGDRLIFGKMIPLELLGVYSVAAMLATFASQGILSIGGSVLFPAYSRRVRSGQPVGPVFEKVRSPLAVLAGYSGAGVVAAGPTLIQMIYPPTYAEAAWMLPPLAIGGLLEALECANGAALLAYGEAKWVAAGNGAKLIGMVVLIPVGYHFWGFPGAIGMLTACGALRYGTSVLGVGRHGLRPLGRDLLVAAWMGVTAAGGYYLGAWMKGAGAAEWIRFLAQCALVTAAWSPMLYRVLGMVRRRGA